MKRHYLRRKLAYRMWLEIREWAEPILKAMDEHYNQEGSPITKQLESGSLSEHFNLGVNVGDDIFEHNGYIFKIARGHWTAAESYRCLPWQAQQFVAPTIVVKFGDGVYKVLIQKKYFSASMFYAAKNISMRGMNCARFCRWQNFLRWFARGTDMIVPKKEVGNWKGSPRFVGHNTRYRVGDIHAENIALDNGKPVLIDW